MSYKYIIGITTSSQLANGNKTWGILILNNTELGCAAQKNFPLMHLFLWQLPNKQK